MKYDYKTTGTCSKSIEFELTDNIIHNVRFNGGCNGNGKGVSALVENMPAEELIKRLKGIKCGFKDTSCPDQLATAVQLALDSQNK